MKKFKKLLSVVFAAGVVFCALSISCRAAQITGLSVEDGVLTAQIKGANNSNLFVSGSGTVNFAKVEGGFAEIRTSVTDGKIFLWDSGSLAPLSLAYDLRDGRAYERGASEPVPAFDESSYNFDQSSNIMVVGNIENGILSGFRGGEKMSYTLADSVDVVGLADSLESVTPGTVILPGFTREGVLAAAEVLALPGDKMAENYGIYDPSDGSGVYQNIVARYYAKSGTTIRVKFPPDSETKVPYIFESSSWYYSLSNSDGQTNLSRHRISDKSGIPPAAEYNVYMYIRYNKETEKATEAVFFSTKKAFSPGGGDDEYSPIFKLNKKG